MWKSLQLRTKMLIMLIIPMLIILAGTNLYSYYRSHNMLNDQILETASYIVESKSNTIYSSLKEKEVLVAVVAEVLGAKEISQPEEVEFLKQIKASSPGVKSAFTGHENLTCADSQGVTEKEKAKGYDPRSRGWYKTGVAADGVGYTEVYEASLTKELSVSVTKKIMHNGKLTGVAGIDMDIKPIQQLAQEFKIGKSGYAAILDEKGNFLSHPSYGLKDNISQVENGMFAEYVKGIRESRTLVQTGMVGGVETLIASTPIGKSGWTFLVFVPKAELFEQVNILGRNSFISGITGLVILGLIILLSTLAIVKRIRELDDMAGRIANGDLTVATGDKRKADAGDEIGSLQRKFRDMTNNLCNLISHVQRSAKQVADSAEQFSENSQQSAQTACSVAASISTVTQGAEAQVTALKQVSAVVEKMSASIEELVATANNMANVAESATAATASGRDAVHKAVTQMDNMVDAANKAKETSGEMERGSKQIGEIVELISNIAGQTNLLALNAAIEAARAGEQGRGFAVVAEEVRRLAEQSDRAAQQITELIRQNNQGINNVVSSIETAITNVNDGVAVVNSADAEFSQITGFVAEVASYVEVISQTLEQLAAGSQQIVLSVNAVETTCQETTGELQNVSAAVQEQSASVQEIASSCMALSNLAEQLTTQVNKFKIR